MKEKKFYNGIYDRVFKTIFCSDKQLMKEFLNKILDLNIKTIEYLDKDSNEFKLSFANI